MKKENRKLAQERRAEERRIMEQKKKLKKYLAFGLPVAALIILVIVLAVYNSNGNSSSKENDTSEISTSSTGNNATESTGLSTDESLAVKNGDTVNIDYVGSVDGVEFDGGSTKGNGTDLVIGSNTYIDDLSEQEIWRARSWEALSEMRSLSRKRSSARIFQRKAEAKCNLHMGSM